MSVVNDFVPFCNENTGTNLPTQSAYLANPALLIGNQPGIASSSLNNKAIRQASTMGAVLAQAVADALSVSMLDNQNTADHAIPTSLYKAVAAQLRNLSPVQTVYGAGSGTHKITYKFFINTPAVSPTAGATYSDGTTVYTVSDNYNGIDLHAKGGADPTATTGTLTKTGGTGDATLTFYCYRKPIYIDVICVGGGGAGGGASSTSGSQCSAGAGGGGGSFCKLRITAPSSSFTYTTGAGGTAGTAGNNPGNGGGTTTFTDSGTVNMSAGGGNGGSGGVTETGGPVFNTGSIYSSGAATGGDINIPGGGGFPGVVFSLTQASAGGGGASPFAPATVGLFNSGTATGSAGIGYGGGGSGALNLASQSARQGGVGSDGVTIIDEHYQ